MTPPKEPLWRFAIPLSPTMKCYRPTHKAANSRGAVGWDTSYMSTIGLEGKEKSIEGLLKALRIGVHGDSEALWQARGRKWRQGLRVWEGWVYERNSDPANLIAPVTIIWCPMPAASITVESKVTRRVIVRVHPSAFFQLWEETLKLCKIQKPAVTVEDLRFEIGSIEIQGPAATEALVGSLYPVKAGDDRSLSDAEAVWSKLAPLTNTLSLPRNALLAFDITDPRLHHPPRTVTDGLAADEQLVQMLANWPIDQSLTTLAIFDRNARLAASHTLPSQKSINRRKAAALPGQYPEARPIDPKIPVLLHVNSSGSWTLLAPWKCILPIWYSVVYYPLSTGGNVRFGGLEETRQLAHESSQPWFPGDFPGTKAGDQWEESEQEKRKRDWAKRPRGKRIAWDSVPLGNGRKGEIGKGWACDWSVLGDALHRTDRAAAERVFSCQNAGNVEQSATTGALVNVKITLLSRGVPQPCARVYRLPSTDPELLQKWLALAEQPKNGKKSAQKIFRPPPRNATQQMRAAYLAHTLLEPPAQPGDGGYPVVPDEVDLVGFVTTGNYNLSEGRGTGIGSLLLSKVVEGNGDMRERKLCIVRDAGQGFGRLASWELV